MTDEFKCFEQDAAEQAGLSQDQFKAARTQLLQRNVDYAMVGNKIAYTEEAMSRVLASLDITVKSPQDGSGAPDPEEVTRVVAKSAGEPVSPPPALPEAGTPPVKSPPKAAPDPDELTAELRVCRIYPNPHIIGAKYNGKIQRVRVNSSKNFKVGMLVPARYINDNLWELTKKCPRRPGKW